VFGVVAQHMKRWHQPLRIETAAVGHALKATVKTSFCKRLAWLARVMSARSHVAGSCID
jgi:Arc/MetJ family transcription regulator